MARRKPKIKKPKNVTNKRRKGALSVVIPWFKRFGLILSIVVSCVWIGAWVWLSGSAYRGYIWAQDHVLMLSAEAGFTVRNILVEGRVNTDPSLIMALVNVQAGDPLFYVDPDEARRLIEKTEWVSQAYVARRLPDTVYIRLEERVPIGILNLSKGQAILDQQGTLITRTISKKFEDLIVIDGGDDIDNAQREAPRFLNILRGASNVYMQTKSVSYIGGRRWDVVLKNGVRIKLPEDDPAMAIQKLVDIDQQEGVLNRDILSIDLREPDRFTVRARPGAVQQYQAQVKGEGV